MALQERTLPPTSLLADFNDITVSVALAFGVSVELSGKVFTPLSVLDLAFNLDSLCGSSLSPPRLSNNPLLITYSLAFGNRLLGSDTLWFLVFSLSLSGENGVSCQSNCSGFHPFK